ncbi:hypothetical protein OPV22_018042 [Ensete ventricosum]|uniref:MaoC-like domain-containing protein n=1 Tax=Ensete ventricosum TaxID=4639 RepID=A0AAV8QZD3_ENSVE|nr:hypothetical protein OPV22_018042 [Ensete ventricosum]
MQLVRSSRPRLASFCSPFSSASAEGTARLLRVGHVLRESRRFSESDVVRYSEVSGDRNPVHLDDAFARTVAGFDGGRVVHGMLVASLFPSVISSHFPGAVYVSQTLTFKLPVYVGDEVLAEMQVTYLRQYKNKYMVKFTTKCFTNEDSLVVEGEATTIISTLTSSK